MKKINITFILYCVTFLFSSAAYWYYGNVQLKCYPEGAAKVIAGFNTKVDVTNPSDKEWALAPKVFDVKTANNATMKINTLPVDVTKYEFDHWEDNNGKIVSTKSVYSKTLPKPGWLFSKGELVEGLAPNDKKSDASGNPGTITHTYIAVYREIKNVYVITKPDNPNVVAVEIDKPEHKIGETVTIHAYPTDYYTKFIGWEKDGKIVSTEPYYSIAVSEATEGTYIARTSSGHSFLRIQNKATNRFINAINDVGSISDFTSLSLCNEGNEIAEAGTIFQISKNTMSGGTSYRYLVQNVNTLNFYDESNGVYVTSVHFKEDNTWNIQANRAMTYMADNNLQSNHVQAYGVKDAEVSRWYYEPMDKDLTTKENYFTFSPDKLLLDESTGKYYTTLRTAWNVLYDTNEITAYIVTGVDEDGILIKTPVTGNIIPKNTCVLIECNSNDTQRNVMVPTNQATSFTATGNILVSAENGKYFPNQPESRSNCKALVLNDGVVGFGGEACTKTNGNDAYLLIDDEANVSDGVKSTTLEEVVDKQTVDKKYKITDLTCVYTFMKDGKAMFFCKDDNGYEDKDEISNGQIDFLKEKTQLMNENNRTDHDQSNWIILEAPASMQITNGEMNNLLSQRLAGVEGKLVDVVNPKLSLSKVPQPYEMNGYTLNTFIPSNFYGYSADDKYYFVTPKPNEMASIHWAMYNGDNHFSAPTNVGTSNPEGLEGEFEVDFSLFNEEMPELIENNVYSFNGLVTKLVPNSSAAKRTQGVVANYYLVYPISNFKWEGSVVDGIVTGINDVNAGRKVMSVKYINVTGNQSSKPFDGINIMVTTYSDGTVGSRKFVK